MIFKHKTNSENKKKRFHFSFSHKICLGAFGTCFTFFLFIICTFAFLKKVINEENTFISTYAEQLIFAERMQNAIKTQFSIVPVFVLSGKDELVAQFDKAHEQFTTISQRLERLTQNDDDLKAIRHIRDLELALYQRATPGIKMRQSGVSRDAVHGYFSDMDDHSNSLNDAINNFVHNKSASFEQARLKTFEENSQIVRDIVFITVGVIFACVLSLMFLLRALQEKRLADQKNEILFFEERRLSMARKETVEVVAHDLKNPLSTIKMSLELILENLNKDSDNKELVQIAFRSTEFMQKLIHTLLDHAKIESGHLALDLVHCNAVSFLDKVLLRFKPLAAEKNIKIETLFENRGLTCRLDLVRMEQVFANLLDNAIKFTPQDGKINCTAQERQGAVEFRFTNSGPGISEEHIALVFERFWQKRSTAKQGAGLGLAITKSIVEAHGGKISVTSRPGEETTFQVILPLAAKETQEHYPVSLVTAPGC